MIFNMLRIVVVSLFFFPTLVFSCCSSPLAETVFYGKIVSLKTIGEVDDVVYQIHIEKTEDIFGDAPETYIAEIHELTMKNVYRSLVDIGNLYLITLYDQGKHDSRGKFLSKDSWAESKLAIHPYIGFLKKGDFGARVVKKYVTYNRDLNWTKDFKLMNVFFLQE